MCLCVLTIIIICLFSVHFGMYGWMDEWMVVSVHWACIYPQPKNLFIFFLWKHIFVYIFFCGFCFFHTLCTTMCMCKGKKKTNKHKKIWNKKQPKQQTTLYQPINKNNPQQSLNTKQKLKKTTNETTFNNGCLGSGIDEERSKPR